MLSEKISNWIRSQVRKAKAEGVVVGLSGGVDSAVVAALSKKALGENVLGLIMPCKSSLVDQEDAFLVASHLKLKTKIVSLDSVYDLLVEILPKGSVLSCANLKPRLRMLVLYYFSNNLNYLVAGTGNKSELLLGYFTKYGDGGVDILPIGDLLKSDVENLARELGIPEKIIKKTPSAGLWPGQTDEKEIGLSYETLNKAIFALESRNKDEVEPYILSQVKELIKKSRHKRTMPKCYKVKRYM